LNYDCWTAAVTIDDSSEAAMAIYDDRLAMAIDGDRWTAMDQW
jgi:hypothetical protein